MPHIKFSATRFVLNEASFTKALADQLIEMMTEATTESLRAHMDKIPVWTGESRGGLRAIAEALGVDLNIVPEHDRRIRKNRFGQIKSPTSAPSEFIPPHRFKVYSINMSFVNNADGFEINDRFTGPANLIHPTPWGFTESFRRGIRSRLSRMVRNKPLPVSKFVLKKTIYSE